MPMNPAYSPQQAAAALQHITVSCFITSTHITLPYKQPRSTKPVLDHVAALSAVGLGKIVVVNDDAGVDLCRSSYGTVDFDWLMSLYDGQLLPRQTQLSPRDTINLQFTSGTTSAPKAVCLSHHDILNNAYVGAALFGILSLFVSIKDDGLWSALGQALLCFFVISAVGVVRGLHLMNSVR